MKTPEYRIQRGQLAGYTVSVKATCKHVEGWEMELTARAWNSRVHPQKQICREHVATYLEAREKFQSLEASMKRMSEGSYIENISDY